jgi:hypothetical protein
MKKILFYLITAFFTTGNFAFAENSDVKNSQLKNDSGEKCFDENTHIVNLGIGFGGVNYYKVGGFGYTYGRTPAFSVSYEQAIHKKLGIGYLGVGAYAGFQSAHARYNYNTYYGNPYFYEHHWNYFMIAARAAYHFDFLNSPKAEVYAGAIVGLRIQTYSYETNDPDPYQANRLHDGAVFPSISLLVGARWYFVPKVALFAEAGWGISYGTVGFSFKF